MGSRPRPGSCRGPRGAQVPGSEHCRNFRLLCAFLQGAPLCPTCSGDGESRVVFFLVLGVFFLPTRLAVFCRLLLWARASREDAWASWPRASCCWLPPGQASCEGQAARSLGETEAREGCWAASPKALGGNGESLGRGIKHAAVKHLHTRRTLSWGLLLCPRSPPVAPALGLLGLVVRLLCLCLHAKLEPSSARSQQM